jgi:hypothetical protein
MDCGSNSGMMITAEIKKAWNSNEPTRDGFL